MLRRLHPLFVAEVGGVELSRPVEDATVAEIAAALEEHSVLVFHDQDLDDGRALLCELLEFATQPEFVYRHAWRPKDLVVWDNRAVLHRGRPWDAARYRRVMHRTTVAGDGPTVSEV